MANRCASVRAAILGTPSALFGLMHELGVNLLIFERERLSLAQIRSSIDSFLHGKSSINPAIASVLAGKGAAIPEQPAGCPCGKPCPCRKQ